MVHSEYKDIDFRAAVELTQDSIASHKPHRMDVDGARKSAVMILFKNINNSPHLIFTKRTDFVETHKGQISFPGGVQDSTDKNLYETAIRETHEEIGITAASIRFLGELDDFFTVTNFIVSPFCSVIEADIEYVMNEKEVAEILEVPLYIFLDDSCFEVKKWKHQGKLYDVYFYYFENHVIWGATAFILNQFIHRVFKFNPAPHPITEDPRNRHYLLQNNQRNGSRKENG